MELQAIFVKFSNGREGHFVGLPVASSKEIDEGLVRAVDMSLSKPSDVPDDFTITSLSVLPTLMSM